MHRVTAALAMVILTSTACAETAVSWMSDADIKRAFAGTTINGVYADGKSFTETYATDGRISYTDHRATLSGRWSVVNRAFCTLYDSFITGGCFQVIQHSGNCFEFYFVTGTEGEAASDAPKRPSWTARGWDRSRPATCDDKPAV